MVVNKINHFQLRNVGYKLVFYPFTLRIAILMLNHYAPKNASNIHNTSNDVFSPIFEKMVNAEMDAHLGYEKSSQEPKVTENRRNGFTSKKIQGSFGETQIQVQEIEMELLSL